MPNAPRKVTKKAKAILRSSGAKTVRSVADEVLGAAMTAGAAVVISKLADALKPLGGESSTPEPVEKAASPAAKKSKATTKSAGPAAPRANKKTTKTTKKAAKKTTKAAPRKSAKKSAKSTTAKRSKK